MTSNSIRAAIFLLSIGVLLGDPAKRTTLPQTHPYQQQLREFLGSLTEADFDHGVTEPLTETESSLSLEEQYRLFVMTMMHQPLVGSKRGAPAINAPSWLFLLSTIEGPPPTPPTPEEPDKPTNPAPKPAATDEAIPIPVRKPAGIVVPPVWPESLIAFTQWDYAGNPYHNNPGLKMRALVTAAVKMIMLDDYFEQNPDARRTDLNGYKLFNYASTYLGAKDLLPPKVREAFETGLMRLGSQLLSWGVWGEERNKDMCVPIGLWVVAKACDNAEFAKKVEEYARWLMSDPDSFHPAGYWIERGGGIDVGFGGGANFYAVWAALMTDWPFAKETAERAYRLRAHLSLRDPDGFLTGPSHFNSRLGTPASADQWHWDGARDHAAAMVTDEAACFIHPPAAEELAGAAANRVAWFNFQIKQNPVRPDTLGRKSAKRTGYWANEDLRGKTWTWRLRQTYNFPIGINIGQQFYRGGSYARLVGLQKSASPMLETPFERGGGFLRNFADTFVVSRQKNYGAILHTGPVGEQPAADGKREYPGPLGFGGGQLSAFWTPETGSVILGRRIATRIDKNWDSLDSWRQWPHHAIAGQTAEGAVITSARNVRPTFSTQGEGRYAVEGAIPAVKFEQRLTLKGEIKYHRTFSIGPEFLRIESAATPDGNDKLTELYETLPVYLRDARRQAKSEPTNIEWTIGDEPAPATSDFADGVTAVLLHRFDGSVRIDFGRPRRVRLSPEVWPDPYLTKATCRNVMIDLLDGDEPRVTYQIRAVEK